MAVLFWIFLIRSVQNGSNLIKLDQIEISHQSKNAAIKSCHNMFEVILVSTVDLLQRI